MNMIKYVAVGLLALSITACSSDSGDGDGDNPPASPPTDNGNNNNGQNSGNNGTAIDSGALPGVWFGSNHFGSAVMVIDANLNTYSFASNGSGQHQAAFGPANGAIEHYTHRNSDNAAFADSFTLVGDFQPDTFDFNLQLANEAQQVNNTTAIGNFSMTRATADNVQTISVADMVGSWSAKTSYAPTGGDLLVTLTVAADGTVGGGTQNNADNPIVLSGTLSAAAGSNQYLSITFDWLGFTRSGVVYKDPNDVTRLFLNTRGPGGADGLSKETFTATLIRQ